MYINLHNLQAIIALAGGVLILIMPKLFHYIVALYLIIIGLMGIVRI